MGARGVIPKSFYVPQPEASPMMNLDHPEAMNGDHVAIEEWNRIVPELVRTGRISSLDTTIIRLYCNAVSEYQCLSEFIAENGLTYSMESGMIRPRPEVAMRDKAHDKLIKTTAELGFTPNARARMQLPTNTTPSDATPVGSKESIRNAIKRNKKTKGTS